MSRAAQLRRVAGCLAGISLAAASTLSGRAGGDTTATQPRDRIIHVTVVDSSNDEPVLDLTADSLIVLEDGVRREILRVSPATSSMPIAIIVDNSDAAAPAIRDLRRALTTFVKALDGVGPLALVSVADRPTILADYSPTATPVLDAINRLFHSPNSGATLLDGIAYVAKGLARNEAERAAIVVVTTENTDYSNMTYQHVLEALGTSGVTMHAIVLVNPSGSFRTDEARNRATVLDRGPRESGGVRMDVLTSMSFEPRLDHLAAIMKAQYRIVYSRPESLIPPERIEVRAAKTGLMARGTPARRQDQR
ncbi:MAG: VWA domain-containing protein [Acidobacteriota bacterium]